MGVQHLIAMFGATALAPILMGFDPNVAMLMSGIGALIFFLMTSGQVPSYWGSSFVFIGVVIAATGYAGQGPNANIGVALVAVLSRGMVQRLLILVGLLVASVIYAVLTNGLGFGKPLDVSGIANAMLLIAPVAIILVAANLGHIKAVTAMTGKDMDRHMGRAVMGDGVATMVAGGVGGTGVTTYAEDMGVMAATKIYSTAIFLVAGCMAVVLGFSPQFGALIQAIALPVMGGVDRGVWPDCGGWRQNRDRQPGGLFRQPQPAGGGHYPGAGHERIHAEVRRLCAGRHWHRDLGRDFAVGTAGAALWALTASGRAAAPGRATSGRRWVCQWAGAASSVQSTDRPTTDKPVWA